MALPTTNEEVIKQGQDQVVAQAASLQAELEDRIAALQLVANLEVKLDDPVLGYAIVDLDLAEYKTALTADFESGILYPDAQDIIASAQIEGYDSEFLQYLEDELKSAPSAGWVSQLRAIQQTYTEATTTSAQNYVSTFFQSAFNNGVDPSAEMLEQVNDTANTESVEALKLWETIANDLLISYQQQAHDAGLSIEALRAKITLDMIAAHSDYNQANLMIAQKDLSALKETLATMRGQINTQLEEHSADKDEAYERFKQLNRDFTHNLDVDLIRIDDQARITMKDYELQVAKELALISSVDSGLSQALLSGTFHGNYTSKTEV